MAIPVYLAMTEAEMRVCPQPPASTAWMACHFSPYETGIAGFPKALPTDTLLILNDRIPFRCHDPVRILQELTERMEQLSCSGLLLDFQESGSEPLKTLCRSLTEGLPFPVACPMEYAIEGHPVFLPPIPADQKPEDYLLTWKGWEIWQDLSAAPVCITVSKNGTSTAPAADLPPYPMTDGVLFCHYRTAYATDTAQFTLKRTASDLKAMLPALERLGVSRGIGLYQELGESFSEK